jgi:hypothetical protein
VVGASIFSGAFAACVRVPPIEVAISARSGESARAATADRAELVFSPLPANRFEAGAAATL